MDRIYWRPKDLCKGPSTSFEEFNHDPMYAKLSFWNAVANFHFLKSICHVNVKADKIYNLQLKQPRTASVTLRAPNI